MNYQQIQVSIKGLVPTLQHNGQLADPINPFAKALKTISGKRTKTDSDYAAMAKIEWFGSLYLNQPANITVDKGHINVFTNGQICWPGENIEGMLYAAAKKKRQGPLCKEGVLCDGNFPLQFNSNGHNSLNDLWEDPNFRLTVKSTIQKKSVMRTRPMFKSWTLNFNIDYLPDIVNKDTIEEWIELAAIRIGLSDWRPKYGRFEILEIS